MAIRRQVCIFVHEKIKITRYCPDYRRTKIKKNGKKSYGKQNYLCKKCGWQLIGGRDLRCKACHSSLTQKLLLMLIRGTGVRDIAEIGEICIKKVLSALVNSRHLLQPKQACYHLRLSTSRFFTSILALYESAQFLQLHQKFIV
jgi:transposase-like protein